MRLCVLLRSETLTAIGNNTLTMPNVGDGGGRGMSKGGKVNSTCCRVHKNAELVPDNAGIRMYVRTTRQVPKDSEILVMYQSDRGFFGGVYGRCKCCLCEKRTPECCA
jgi:hypothetical protein